MKKLIYALTIFVHLHLFAQVVPGPQQVNANQVTYSLVNPAQKVPAASVWNAGNPGPAIWVYWIVANFTTGSSSPAGPFIITNGPNAISSGNAINIAWVPVFGATSYDLLSTGASLTVPGAGLCNCLVQGQITSPSFTDTGTARSNYTVSIFDPATVTFTEQNEALSSKVSALTWRVGTIGTKVGSVSSTGNWSLPALNGFFYVDGITYPTVQSAISSACAAGGGFVYAPPGQWPQNSAFVLCNNLTVAGSGRGQPDVAICPTTITTTMTAGDLFPITGLTMVHLEDFCVKNTAASGANAAIRLNYGQFVTAERLYILGPFARAIQLNPVEGTGSTIFNSFRDIHMGQLAASGIGCLVDSGAAINQTNNSNLFENVDCTGGSGGVGLKITGTNQINNEISVKGGQFTAPSGTGIQVTASAARDLDLNAVDAEANTTGINIAAGNTGTVRSSNFVANTTNLIDSSAGGMVWIGSNNVGGTTRNWQTDYPGNQKVNSLCIAPAVCDPGNLATGSGSVIEASGTTIATLLNTAFQFNKPVDLIGQSAPPGLAGAGRCYFDSTANVDECSYNNGSFFPLPLLTGDLGNTGASPQVLSTHISGATTNRVMKANATGNMVNSSITDDGNKISSTEFTAFGNTIRLTSDLTLAANTSLQTIFSWTLPAQANNWSFHCWVPYSQATAAVSDAFGIQAATNAATRIDAGGVVYTAAGTSTSNPLTNLTTTTATNIVTFTPSATATVFNATLEGTIQAGASPPTINIMASQSNSGDLLTIKTGAYCSLQP